MEVPDGKWGETEVRPLKGGGEGGFGVWFWSITLVRKERSEKSLKPH